MLQRSVSVQSLQGAKGSGRISNRLIRGRSVPELFSAGDDDPLEYSRPTVPNSTDQFSKSEDPSRDLSRAVSVDSVLMNNDAEDADFEGIVDH